MDRLTQVDYDSPTMPRDRFRNQLLCADAGEALRRFPPGCVDLIVTSPPYADQRQHTYGGVPVDAYVAWFCPIAEQLRRVLKPTGSFVLNIKERVVAGERHTYVLELILALRRQGWLWTEEYLWHKKNCHPGKWPNRFRDAWERCLHFTRQRQFAMYQEQVMVPMGHWRHARLKNLSDSDRRRDNSRVDSGFGKKISNWIGREMAYPSNVLHLATECGNRRHSAAFPVELPGFFIRVFTRPGDWVLDPFVGSGTTAVAAARLGRDFTGIDLRPEYIQIARDRVAREIGAVSRVEAPSGGVEARIPGKKSPPSHPENTGRGRRIRAIPPVGMVVATDEPDRPRLVGG